VDACWRGVAVSFIGIGFLTFQSMVASNRIVRFLDMHASIANDPNIPKVDADRHGNPNLSAGTSAMRCCAGFFMG
jgi:hypothetical protein